MAGLKVHKVVDDMACGEETLPKLVRTVSDVLERCLTFGLTVNSKKSILASSSINFVGYHIKKGTIEVDSSKVDAIQKFPIPATLTDLRSFLGLVNQLGKFLPNLASYTSQFCPLLKSKNAFLWLPEHTKIFEETNPVLDMCDPSLETILLTDASRLGLGFALTQLKDGVPKLIQFGSRFLKDCESRYAMVELETLAIYWAVKKCNLYLAGINFHVVTDHKPLVSIFNRQILSEIENPRVLNYRTRLLGYNFVVDWKQGINHAIPDALSRAPVSKSDADSDPDPLGDPQPLTIASLRSEYPDLILDDIIEFAKTDEAYTTLKTAILADTVKCAKSGYVSLFKKVASELSVDEDVVLRNKQIVIPPSAVKEILKRLHTSHQGVEKTKRWARQIVYWPGFTSDIANTVAACPQCMFFRPSHQPEPLVQDFPPTRPFQVVSADLFTYGQCEYLVYSFRISVSDPISEFTQFILADERFRSDVFVIWSAQCVAH